jgi:phage N-6-adenine-methyltransferase
MPDGSLKIADAKVVGRNSISHRNLWGSSPQFPQPDQLLREGRAANRRILDYEKGIRSARKAILLEWLGQAERLWTAAEIHKLKGKHFEVFARQIGVDLTSAYRLLKLHSHRPEVIRQCRSDNHWPGWEPALAWFKQPGDDDAVENGEPTTRNRGILTPTWQRFKVADDEYSTPQDLFDHYHRRFKFTLDVCATPKLAKCKKFFTPEQDGLKQDWGKHICWMNPPYSRRPESNLEQWVRKAWGSAQKGAVVVCLLPTFTDCAWWHDFASHATIGLLRGRLQFGNRDANGYTPFGHGIYIFRQNSARRGNRLNISLDGHRIGTSSKR